MRKTYFIILSCIICMLSIKAKAQIPVAFELNYVYDSHPDATVIGAKFTEFNSEYFTVEAFENDGFYYLCLRNVDQNLTPNFENSYLINDPNFDKILELTEFYYNYSYGDYLVVSGLLQKNGEERTFWAYFDAGNQFQLDTIKVLDGNSGVDPIEYAKGETSNAFKNYGDPVITGATGNNNAYILSLINENTASGIQLTGGDYLLNECAIYDVARHPTNPKQYVFVGEYKTTSSSMTEIVVGRFIYEGGSFSEVNYGGIEFKNQPYSVYPFTELRARDICFGENNTVYIAGDFTHGDFSSQNTTYMCDEIFYMQFDVFSSQLFTTYFLPSSIWRIQPSQPWYYRGVDDLISRGDLQVPLIFGTSVPGFSCDYNNRFIYQIGDDSVNFDEGGTYGVWYSDSNEILVTAQTRDWKVEFYSFEDYAVTNTCLTGFNAYRNQIPICNHLWTDKETQEYTQEYTGISSTLDFNQISPYIVCGSPNLTGPTFRKISIPNPEDNNSEISIDMYPNPANESFSIFVSEQYNIHIYNTMGKLVYKQLNCNNESLVDVSNLQSAIYIVKISTANEVFDKKIIIE